MVWFHFVVWCGFKAAWARSFKAERTAGLGGCTYLAMDPEATGALMAKGETMLGRPLCVPAGKGVLAIGMAASGQPRCVPGRNALNPPPHAYPGQYGHGRGRHGMGMGAQRTASFHAHSGHNKKRGKCDSYLII